MDHSLQSKPALDHGVRRLIRLRIWLSDHLFGSESRVSLIWAVAIGIIGAWVSIAFKESTDVLLSLFTGVKLKGFVASFQAISPTRRLFVPIVGAFFAGFTLFIGHRFKKKSSSTDYMEAVVVGDGNLAVKSSLIKCTSAWFSAASGASIGREGPLVLLCSLTASILGRWLKFPLARKRLLVACGAATGIASAYNAPIAGAFFVAEIVLGSLAMEAFGPLVIASVVATLVTRSHYGAEAIYSAPVFSLQNNRDLLPYLLLGLLCGACAPLFLNFLKFCERAFAKLKLAVWLRLTLGGLLVGILAYYHPEVTGNGRSLVFSVLHHPSTWQALAAILFYKILATGITFGSGAVGGVFTPTLFTGSAIGYLFGVAASFLLPSWGLEPSAFGLVGMGAFLAASTGAPIMAIVMIFELTLNYQILMPVMLASVMGYYLSRSLSSRSLYKDALERKGAAAVAQHLATLKIDALMQPDSATLLPHATFTDIINRFLHTRHDFIYIVDQQQFIGSISLHDIKPFLDRSELAECIIAIDILHSDLPQLRPDMTMSEALSIFASSNADRLPVTTHQSQFLGVISQSDILLFLAGKPKSA